MKRSKQDDDEDSGVDIVEEDEAKADREENRNPDDSSDDEDDDDGMDEDKQDDDPNEMEPIVAESDVFLDSFYGISSLDAYERAQAAQVMLYHCLLGPDANTKDASYALRRLTNGLCSGRAAARQGNAAALASFLKAAFALGKMDEIKRESDGEELSNLAFVRRRLLTATEPGEKQGKKKSSEERDCYFGRLFGINGIVRSGILSPSLEDHDNIDDFMKVVSGFLNDLADLYGYKKWIREPAAHSICILLNFLYSKSSDSVQTKKVVEHAVNTVVIPRLMMKGDCENNEPLFLSYSAEQIAIAINIQMHAHQCEVTLPSPLDQPILSKETIAALASVLAETSATTQLRTHLLWDVLWCYISEPYDSLEEKSVEIRRERRSCPIGEESVSDVLESILHSVVEERLLGLDENTTKSGKATEQRRTLALSLIRNLAGVEFISSLTRKTRLILGLPILDSLVLRPIIVKGLFLDVICAGSFGQKNQGTHTLKPLALEILNSITKSLIETKSGTIDNARRLTAAKSFLTCEPRFDSKTKTSTVETLLGLNPDTPADEIPVEVLSEYSKFLQTHAAETDESYKANGYLDLLFKLGRRLLQIQAHLETEQSKLAQAELQKILIYLMTAAFFNCESVNPLTISETKNKKKKAKNQPPSANRVQEVAFFVKNIRKGTFPFETRTVASARFFSLLTENVLHITRSSDSDRAYSVLGFLSLVTDSWKELLTTGAKQLAVVGGDDSMTDSDDECPHEIVAKLRKAFENTVDTDKSTESKAKKRWTASCAILSTAIYLHLLNPGRDAGVPENDDPNVDEDEDADEIISSLSDVYDVHEAFLSSSSEKNPLHSLTELCCNVLSSPLGIGNQSRGAAPTLLREAVRLTWICGLSLAAHNQETLFDMHSVNLLLNAIGATDGSIAEEVSDDDESESMEEDSSSDESDERGSHSNKNSKHTGNDSEKIQDDDFDMKAEDGSIESEVEIDGSRLQSMLEEASDAEIDEKELEHHEGADAALARLIEIKKEARKAGQMAREKTEIARQIRCIPLIEALLVGKPETWGPLLRCDTVIEIALSILKYRKEIYKSLEKLSEKSSTSVIADRRALLDRLTALIKTKVLKAKVPDSKWSVAADVSELSSDLATRIFREASSIANKDHQILCNSLLLFLLRCLETDERIIRAEIYALGVSEWATKRTSRLDVSFFESFIHHNPVLAQACLVTALASAASNARTHYLKAECFRLLSLLYNTKLNAKASILDNRAFEQITHASKYVLSSISGSLNNIEMKKTKRVREVLKTADKVISFLAASEDSTSPEEKTLEEIKGFLTMLIDDTDSQGIKNLAERLQKEIDGLIISRRSLPHVNKGAQSSVVSDQKKKKNKSKKKKK